MPICPPLPQHDDGEAEQTIEAWHLRNRLHLCYDEEKTLTRLVEDWSRHAKAEPDSSTVVLARTRAEARALSWLMRERVLARTPDAKRAVIEVSQDLDRRLTEPLEIAVGDRLRIGATQWDKQLFNGTVVTVEDLEVRRAEEAAVTRKARNRQAAGREPQADTGAPEPEYSVHVTARADDGRRVTFRHDEIRDWHDNIRLDYGYAMTIASAQGLTVDRAFLLVDDRPARETIYPAATRHREALDVYVNRSPIVFDIAERRPEDQADMPVADSDVRAYLAERWSRSQPKEAALDYVSDGMWRDARQEAHHHERTAKETRQEMADAREASNDNALVRIAQEIPPRGQRLAPWRGRGRLRDGAQRDSGGLGGAARPRQGRGRGRRAQPRLPRDPRPARRTHEAGRIFQGPFADLRAATDRACRTQQRGARRIAGGSCPRQQLPPLDQRQDGFRSAASQAARRSKN